MITKRQYIEYLVSTPANYTCTNLAQHLQGVSHDAVSDYLAQAKSTAHQLWELVQPLLNDSEQAYLIVDDSVQDKRYSNQIELVRKQYSGAEGGLVRGIGAVNLVHTDGVGGNYYPIDYRIYAPQQDGKTKNDHFADMLTNAVSNKRVQAKGVLFDSWCASVSNLKLVMRLGAAGHGLCNHSEKQQAGEPEQRGRLHTLGTNRVVGSTNEQWDHSQTQRNASEGATVQGSCHKWRH